MCHPYMRASLTTFYWLFFSCNTPWLHQNVIVNTSMSSKPLECLRTHSQSPSYTPGHTNHCHIRKLWNYNGFVTRYKSFTLVQWEVHDLSVCEHRPGEGNLLGCSSSVKRSIVPLYSHSFQNFRMLIFREWFEIVQPFAFCRILGVCHIYRS